MSKMIIYIYFPSRNGYAIQISSLVFFSCSKRSGIQTDLQYWVHACRYGPLINICMIFIDYI